MKPNAQPKWIKNALAIAISTSLPFATSQAEEITELATTQASSTETSYAATQSNNIKHSQSLQNTAKTINVIPQAVMKDRNVDNLKDALRSVSGISMAAGEGGTPTGDSMSIRGFSARNDMMIDGIRDIAGYSRDTYNIESIEVTKGPSSAVHGRGATGGSINLQSKTATLDEFTDLSLRLGNANDYRTTLDSNQQISETTAIRVNVLADDGDVAGRDDVFNSKQALSLSLATGLGTKSRLTINADIQQQDNLPDYGLPVVPNYQSDSTREVATDLDQSAGHVAPVNFNNFYGNTNRDFENIDAQSLTVKYEYDISTNTTLRSQTRIGSVERLSIVSAPRFTSTTTDGITTYGENSEIDMGGEKTRDTTDSLAVTQLDLISRIQTGDITHNLVTGIELARETFKRYNYVDLIADNLEDEVVDLTNPDSNLAFTGQYGRDGTSQKATGDTISVYGFNTININEQFDFTAGMRWDKFKTDYQYDYADPSLVLKATNKNISWNLGGVYKASKNTSFYFGAGNSFSPSAEDLTASSRGNNADLKPEETVSYELGSKWQLFNGKLFANAAIFRTQKNHARTDDALATDSYDETLNGKQRVDGFEFSIAGQLTPQLSISTAYTLQNSEVLTAEGDDAAQIGQALPRTPKHSASTWGRYDATEKLAFGLGAQYVGERFNSSDPGSREVADDYLIYDLMISYQASQQLALQFNGSNLTNERYIEQLGGGHFVPGDGRYFSLSANLSL